MSYRRLAALALVVVAACGALFVALRRRPERWPEPVRTETAVGDSTCISCHRDKETFEGTAHRLTMRLPTRPSILGNFRSGENVLRTSDPDVHVRMDADSAGFYQTLVVGKAPDTTSRTERIAIVGGSGRRGQSFLYWSGDHLFQMPASYWTSLGRWIGNPGVRVEPTRLFDRAITARCLECHASWIESLPTPTSETQFRAEGAILGITCERCHAAGKEHVSRERSLLHALRRPAIVNIARLSRVRQMEACAQCHGGLGHPKTPTFTYVAGEPLDDYLHLISRETDTTVDVHGNQVALLSRSKCYRSSQMTCITCHDVHRPQRDLAELSGKCLSCHKERSCPLFAQRGHALVGHCVDCHMPLQASKNIVSELDGVDKPAQIRSHWIRVYPDTATK